MAGSKNNHALLLDNGKIVYWGANHFGQMKMPKEIQEKKYVEIYSDFFQNYAVAEDGPLPPGASRALSSGPMSSAGITSPA